MYIVLNKDKDMRDISLKMLEFGYKHEKLKVSFKNAQHFR